MPLLVTFTGRDAPGITAEVTRVLAAAGPGLLHGGAGVGQGFLTLGLAIELPGGPADEERGLKELLFAAKGLGLELEYRRLDAAAQPQGQRYVVTAISRELGPAALHGIARVLAGHGANIERIHRLSEGGLASVE